MPFLAPALPFIGAGATVYGAINQTRAQDEANDRAAYASSPEAQREALRGAYDTHMEYAPRLAEMDRQMMPGLVDNNLATQERLQFGSEDQRGLFDMLRESTPILNQIAQDSNRSAREADLADVEANAGRVRSSIEAENEGLFGAMEQQEEMARQDMWHRNYADGLEAPGVHQLHDLRQTALDDVARGGRLSNEQLRDVQQYSRQGDSDRGMLRSGSSIGNEILNTEAARKQNLAFADQRLGNMENALNSTRSRQINLRNHLSQGNQQSIQNRLATMIDPFQGVLGRQSINNTNAGMLNQSTQFNQLQSQRANSANDVFATASGIYNTGANIANANANNQAGYNSGSLSGIGGFLNNGGLNGIFDLFRTPGINGSI